MKTTKILVLILLLCIMFSLFAVTASADDYYVVNKTSGKFHLPSCSYLPDSSNRYTIPRDEIENYPGLSPCGHCKPLNNYVYEPENPGQSSGGASSNSSSKDSPQITWLERKEKEGTPILDIIAIIFFGAITYFAGALFIDMLPRDEYYYNLGWFGKISLCILTLISALIAISLLNAEGSSIIKLFINASFLLIIFAISLVSSAVWCLINKDNIII